MKMQMWTGYIVLPLTERKESLQLAGVTYSDGSDPKEVYSFDVPVPTLGDEFDLALIGTKGTWYDHKVSVSNPEAVQ